MLALRTVIKRGLVAAGLAATATIATSMSASANYSQSYLNDYESRVVASINAQRAAHGLHALSYTSCPDGYAESLARTLYTKSTLTHQNIANVMYGCHAHTAGENLVRFRGHTDDLVQLWMDSAPHRANILDPRFTQVGVATQCTSLCTTVADFIG